jgi:hypothetical protein
MSALETRGYGEVLRAVVVVRCCIRCFRNIADMSPLVASSNLPIEAPDKEAVIKRNPHGNWDEVEASRTDYDHSNVWRMSKTPVPTWKAGAGASNDRWKEHKRITIRPYEEGRTTVQNYKLMISTTVPRPIALVTTISSEGVSNIAPFSYFQNVCADVGSLTKSVWNCLTFEATFVLSEPGRR